LARPCSMRNRSQSRCFYDSTAAQKWPLARILGVFGANQRKRLSMNKLRARRNFSGKTQSNPVKPSQTIFFTLTRRGGGHGGGIDRSGTARPPCFRNWPGGAPGASYFEL
jgi:hypothetical protein